MSFTLTDLASDEHEINVNGWNWRPTLVLIGAFNLIDEGRFELMGFNATGVQIEVGEAHEIGRRIRDEVLSKLRPGDRVLYDLSVTDEPDDGTFYRDELSKNYSATYDWLERFAEFCLKSKGFRVD